MEQMIQSRRRAQELRKNQTREENHLWYDFLKTYPVQLRRQYPIGVYYADFFCDKARLVIELDGSQHYEPEVMAYDQKRTADLEAMGLRVLRIPNSDIWKRFRHVCEMIDQEVRARLAR